MKYLFVFLLFNLLTIYCSASKLDEHQSELKKKNKILLPENIMYEINKVCPNCMIASLDDLDIETRDEFVELTSDNTPGIVQGDFDANGLVDYAVLVWKEETSGKGSIQHIEKLIVFMRYNKENIKSRILFENSYEDKYRTDPCIPERLRKSRKDVFLRFGTEEECKFEGFSEGYTTLGKRRVPVVILTGDCIPKEFVNSGACGIFITHGLSMFLTYVPAGKVIKRTKAIELSPGEPDKVTLKFPGIEFIISGQSSRVFYWDEKKKSFNVIWSSD